ncbi:hypothetical protein PTSG_05485 [Salpingoeca rosetta]|uniref:Uncharacterized protein n=1 Tax=Salpingoeca rosetta (strain ATCC 50818 / BSB-021) TaxID=946362 RepID=F2UBC6_SALR5|nr:uncharacterized protein PTSG_05485 [Salpingoeca rosetta]EGD73792.1 hypothetical protein PTSG_05485 [Salpingoeca rosetta]|eukprot:XP_004993355.1 hypothetical protein PTSG_05485 [Salpingoeca rosetta]
MPVAVVDVLVLCVVSVGIAVVAWDPTLPNLARCPCSRLRIPSHRTLPGAHTSGWKEVWLFAGFLAVAVASVLHYHCHVHFQDLDRVASALAAAVGDVAFGVGASTA